MPTPTPILSWQPRSGYGAMLLAMQEVQRDVDAQQRSSKEKQPVAPEQSRKDSVAD